MIPFQKFAAATTTFTTDQSQLTEGQKQSEEMHNLRVKTDVELNELLEKHKKILCKK
jgi:hypothetical protein